MVEGSARLMTFLLLVLAMELTLDNAGTDAVGYPQDIVEVGELSETEGWASSAGLQIVHKGKCVEQSVSSREVEKDNCGEEVEESRVQRSLCRTGNVPPEYGIGAT